MDFFEYKDSVKKIDLHDYSSLLNFGRKWNKIQTSLQNTIKLKIGVTGTNAIQLVVSVFRALLCRYDICAEIYEGEYNGILMDVFDEDSALYNFNPSYVVVIPDFRDILPQSPAMLASCAEVESNVKKTAQIYQNICAKIHEKLPSCQILLSNFVEPLEDPLGSLEANCVFSQSQFIRMVNFELVKNRRNFVTIIDIEKLASKIGKEKWFDESAFFLNKSGFALENIGFFCDAFARQFESFVGNRKKCIVLDLDNTLWGGVVGDLGFDGIMLDPNDAEGEAYIHFQQYLLALKRRGVILAVCSKNDEENAKEPFLKNENMVLRLDDISCFVANWNDKASNIKMIARELNIGVESIVFFDDNPTERCLVRQFVPEVKVVEVPDDPAYYAMALDQSFCFEWNELTVEDINRVDSYSENKARLSLQETCVNYEDFLEKLRMKAKWEKISERTLERFCQLTNKSNQFNLCTRRYSEAEIDGMRNSDEYGLFTVSLCDKFSNYGIIGCVVLRFEKSICFVENWVMSCRVLKKTVENYTALKISEEAKKRNCTEIRGKYIPTKKNSMVEKLYEDLGFAFFRRTDRGKEYALDEFRLEAYRQKYIIQEA